MRIHFVSGLPRSGSTLLAAILRQNPRFRASMSSPVNRLVQVMQEAMSARHENAHTFTMERKRNLLCGIFTAFHGNDSDVIVFDTNRAWTACLPLVTDLFPDSKVICCVRDIGWIMDSFEQALARYPMELSGIWNFQSGLTMVQRVNGLAAGDGMVGFALDALREACAGPHRGRLVLVEYDSLCRNPRKVLDGLYRTIGEEPFRHTFDSVDYTAPTFDERLGMPDLHTVRGEVKLRPRRTILPSTLFSRFSSDTFWREEAGLTIL